MKQKKVTIYTKTICPYCVRAKDLMDKKGIIYNEIKAEDEKLREQLVIKANGMRTVPQIFIDDYHVGGCDDLYALEKDGKLDELVRT